MSCTSYGTMSHVSSRPVTITCRADEPSRRLSRTVANASGRISSSTSATSRRSSPSAPLLPSAPLSSMSIRSRSAGSLADALLLLERGDSSPRARRSAREVISRNFAVWPRSSSSETSLQPRVVLVDLVDDRLDLLPFALVARADDGVDDSLEHAIPYRYSRSATMKSATASGTNPRIDLPSRTRPGSRSTRCRCGASPTRGRRASTRDPPLFARSLQHYDGRKLDDSLPAPATCETTRPRRPQRARTARPPAIARDRACQCVNRVR